VDMVVGWGCLSVCFPVVNARGFVQEEGLLDR